MTAAVKSTAFAAVPYKLMDAGIDSKAIVVYLWLHRFGWNSPKGCYASLQTISDRSGISRKVVQRSLSTLVETGWLEVERRPGTSAVYHVVLDHPGRKRPKVKNDPGQKRPRGQVENDLATQVENDLQTRTHEQEPITRTHVKLENEFPAASDQPVPRRRTKGDPAFEQFWKTYLSAPVRAASQSKPKALGQWQKTLRTETVASLLEALETEISHQHLAAGTFVSPLPDCFRWLRDERYLTVNDRPLNTTNYIPDVIR
jgi:DNA-binding transcriptional MocR family regulator